MIQAVELPQEGYHFLSAQSLSRLDGHPAGHRLQQALEGLLRCRHTGAAGSYSHKTTDELERLLREKIGDVRSEDERRMLEEVLPAVERSAREAVRTRSSARAG